MSNKPLLLLGVLVSGVYVLARRRVIPVPEPAPEPEFVPEPEPEPESELLPPAPAPAPELVGRLSPCPPMGDINNDGIITEEDAQMIMNHLVGNITLTQEQISRAMVRGAALSVADALVISQYVAGYRDTFPVCSVM